MSLFDLGGELKKRAVWAKGRPVPGYDPSEWRLDAFGFLMRYSAPTRTIGASVPG